MHLRFFDGEEIVIVGARELLEANKEQKGWIYERDKGTCLYCGNPFQCKQTVLDHLVPVGKGGGHNPDNKALACRECNRKKGGEILPPAQLITCQKTITDRNFERVVEQGLSWPTSPLLPARRYVRLPHCLLCKSEVTVRGNKRWFGTKCMNVACWTNFNMGDKDADFIPWITNRSHLSFWVTHLEVKVVEQWAST